MERELSTNKIVDIIFRYLSEKQYYVYLTTYSAPGMAEADVFAISKSGIMIEFEIKRSKNDFFNEFKNKGYKHRNLKERKSLYIYDEWKNGKKTGNKIERILIPNKYSFVCIENLLSLSNIPEYAGLYYISKGQLLCIKDPQQGHNE